MVHTACCGRSLVLHSSFALHLSFVAVVTRCCDCSAIMTFYGVKAYDADDDMCTLGSNSGPGAAAQPSRGVIWHNNSIRRWLVEQSWLFHT